MVLLDYLLQTVITYNQPRDTNSTYPPRTVRHTITTNLTSAENKFWMADNVDTGRRRGRERGEDQISCNLRIGWKDKHTKYK